jgi:hypothetical protein
MVLAGGRAPAFRSQVCNIEQILWAASTDNTGRHGAEKFVMNCN